MRIDGVLAEDLLAQKQALISGATPQWILRRAVLATPVCNSTNQMQLTLEPYAVPGSSRTVVVSPAPPAGTGPRLTRPTVQEIEPGIEYVNLPTLTPAAGTAALPALVSAKGIVFDMRWGTGDPTYLHT